MRPGRRAMRAGRPYRIIPPPAAMRRAGVIESAIIYQRRASSLLCFMIATIRRTRC